MMGNHMPRIAFFIIALIVLVPAAAWAQEDDEDATPTIGGKPAAPAPSPAAAPPAMPAPAPESKPSYVPPKMDVQKAKPEAPITTTGGKRLREVMKGFYVESDFGYIRALKTDIPAITSGFLTGILIGYDALDILALEAGFMGGFVFADNPTGESVNPETSALSSDFSMKIIEANVKFSYLSTDHWFFYLRAGGGFSFNSPSETRKADRSVVSISSGAPIVSAAPGVEFYTPVRHFSIGLDPKIYILPTLGSYFLNVLPYVKYTF